MFLLPFFSRSSCRVKIGITWKRNDRPMPQNSPHGPVYKGYRFHGTLTPVTDGDRVEFSDILVFRVNVAGETSDGSIF